MIAAAEQASSRLEAHPSCRIWPVRHCCQKQRKCQAPHMRAAACINWVPCNIVTCMSAMQIGRLQQGQGHGAPQEGDVLRACTCTTFEYSTSALFEVKPATRIITLYGADGQSWPEVGLHGHACMSAWLCSARLVCTCISMH